MVLAHRTGRLHESAYATNSETATQDLSFVTRFVELAVTNAPVRRVLGVGCSTGHCLARFEAAGFDCVGIEPVAELRDVARQRLDGVVIAAPIEEVELEPGSFGAVVLWDSIEHLVDPRAVLEKVKGWLCPGGVLGIATLNHDSLMYSIYHLLRRPLPAIAQGFGDRLYNPFHTYLFHNAVVGAPGG
jgi:2-polyprenyl-3-methyl-5-hydroxy-6-metoxy-1,4-benzoquinol methylase